MNEQEIADGDKIIAEFVKLPPNPSDGGRTYGLGVTSTINGVLHAEEWSVLKFYTSWNWLMPVITHISKMPVPWETQSGEKVTHYPRTFGMINPENNHFMFRFNGMQLFQAPELIVAAWLAVVDFIKYHNSIKNEQIQTNTD